MITNSRTAVSVNPSSLRPDNLRLAVGVALHSYSVTFVTQKSVSGLVLPIASAVLVQRVSPLLSRVAIPTEREGQVPEVLVASKSALTSISLGTPPSDLNGSMA